MLLNGLGDAFDNVMRESRIRTVAKQKADAAAKVWTGKPPATTDLTAITRKNFGFSPFANPNPRPANPLVAAAKEVAAQMAPVISASAPPPVNPSGSTPAATQAVAQQLSPSGGGGGGGGGGGFDTLSAETEQVDNSLMAKFGRLSGIAKVAIFAGGAGGAYMIYRVMTRGARSAVGKS